MAEIDGVTTVTAKVPSQTIEVEPAHLRDPPRPATTTSEEDLHTLGQRRVNLIWEGSQALIALSTVWAVLFVSARLALNAMSTAPTEQQMSIATTAFVLLSNIGSLVIGFYFGRTNHQRVGGVDLGR